jgi:hypothetical protein
LVEAVQVGYCLISVGKLEEYVDIYEGWLVDRWTMVPVSEQPAQPAWLTSGKPRCQRCWCHLNHNRARNLPANIFRLMFIIITIYINNYSEVDSLSILWYPSFKTIGTLSVPVKHSKVPKHGRARISSLGFSLSRIRLRRVPAAGVSLRQGSRRSKKQPWSMEQKNWDWDWGCDCGWDWESTVSIQTPWKMKPRLDKNFEAIYLGFCNNPPIPHSGNIEILEQWLFGHPLIINW